MSESEKANSMREPDFGPIKSAHRYAWLWEPMEAIPSFDLRAMFGVKLAYLDGNLMLGFAGKTDPWLGVLVCTEREHHASLVQEFPALVPHAVLPKWLHLRESHDDFERVATRLVALALHRDPRIGVAPKPARRRAKKK